MELFSIESVCIVDYISNCMYLQLTPVLSNIISLTVISFTYPKVDKDTSKQVMGFVKHT